MNDPADRILRIEEAQAFAERTLDQLHGEVIRAFKELDALSLRIQRLEGRMTSMESADDPDADSGEA